MGIFVLEAFVAQAYEGVGKKVVVSHKPRPSLCVSLTTLAFNSDSSLCPGSTSDSGGVPDSCQDVGQVGRSPHADRSREELDSKDLVRDMLSAERER